MLLETKRVTETIETVEMNVPAYFREDSFTPKFGMICENESIVWVRNGMIIKWAKEDQTRYKNELAEIVSCIPITEEMFFNAYNKVLSAIQASILPVTVKA